MEYVPKRYQQIAAEFLAKRNKAALLLDMGLGKTVVTLTDIDRRLNETCQISKCLVIAPKRVAEDTWSREAEKWEHLKHLRVSKILGSQKQRLAALEKDADVYVTNRDNVVWLIETCSKWPFDMVVIDELTSFKNPTSKRFRAMKKLMRNVPVAIGLTGTPIPKGYSDLWAQIFLLDNGERLGRTLASYHDKWFRPGGHKGYVVFEWILRKGAKEQIDRVLSDLCLAMQKEDWLVLPPILINDIRVKLDKREREVYDTFKTENVLPLLNGKIVTVEDSETAVSAETAAVVSGKLLQMAQGAVYDDAGAVFHIHDKKLDALEEIAETSESLLVFYNYKHDLERLKKRFPKARQLQTVEDIADWNNGKIEMLLAHPKSASYGLNLQEGGHIVVWFGLTWSGEEFDQANARLYRQGQQKSVIIHRIVCEGTVDEHVLDVLDKKRTAQKAMLDALKEEFIRGH